jgi:hypothetical protein
MIRPDHRIVVRPRLPVAAVEEAQRAADERGVLLADFLGDVVADQLPETLADLAREKLDRMGRLAAECSAAHVCRDAPQPIETVSTNSDAPAIARQGISDVLSSPTSSTPSMSTPCMGLDTDACAS